MDRILVDRPGGRVAVLTLNRPSAMNALDRAMTRALRAALADAEADDDIDVLVLTGAGERAFCAGLDLEECAALDEAAAAAYRAHELFPLYRQLDRRRKPAIAAVFGEVLGAGFELALACDLIVAAEGTSFGLPQTRWSLVPPEGGCRKLAALTVAALSSELIFTAGELRPGEAMQLGIADRVVPRGEQLRASLGLARHVQRGSRHAHAGACPYDAATVCPLPSPAANRCLDLWHLRAR
jgi:enoyl-CoA hydratase/carnithine racemase